MNLSSVSFGSGYIKYKDEYIDPLNIVKIKPWVLKTDTQVMYNNDVCIGGRGVETPNDIISGVTADEFVKAAMKAKNSDEIVELKCNKLD